LYITFDDGYEDNALVAAPLLEAYQIPATFFITNKSLSENPSFFWWDILEIIFLKQLNLPVELKLNITHLDILIELDEENNLEYIDIETLLWKANGSVNKRTEAYLKLWNILIGLPPTAQAEIIQELLVWSNVDLTKFDSYKIMNRDMLLDLVNNSYIEIGGHTKSHVSLSQMENEIQENEIRSNKIDIERYLGKELKIFAYPYGRTNEHVNIIVADLKYEAAVTCVSQPILQNSDKMNLGRYQVLNYDAKDLEKMLKKNGF
jgi:peptidoglycan/xylan/chitin deacetylase (PgdA/CDA1 family)